MGLNLFPDIKTPYYIWGPPWDEKSSGVRTLHMLCHALNESGQRAYLVPVNTWYYTNPALNTPVLDAGHNYFYENKGIDPIVVYPDIVSGNPFNAKKSVRYLLAPRGEYGGDAVFSETDKVYGYTRALAENVLCLPTFDRRIFNLAGSRSRKLAASYYAHKYDKIHSHKLLPLTDGAIRCEGSAEQVADILKNSFVCYVYENSEIIINAALCGCPVVLVRTSYFNQLPKDGLTFFGARWSDEENLIINDALLAPSLQTQRYVDQLENEFEDQLQEFIADTQGEWK